MLEIKKINCNVHASAKCIIIMPLYNRRHFLKQAFRSLGEQTFTDWELVVVDDGSTDNPFEEIRTRASEIVQPVTYVRRENGGPGEARATGLLCVGMHDYVAFFDSDDYWLSTYLEMLIQQLEQVEELDWVYCACRRVDYESGETLHESTFLDETSKQPLNFQRLDSIQCGETFVFKNNHELALTQLREPIHAGFQNSVVRAKLARETNIPGYRIGADRYFLMSAVLRGFRVGYVNRVGVIYNVHANNISDTNRTNGDIHNAISVQNELCRSLTDIEDLTDNPDILEEVKQQVAKIRFWIIAYNYCWLNGDSIKALSLMLRVLKKNPTNLKFVKTYISCILKFSFRRTFRKIYPGFKNG